MWVEHLEYNEDFVHQLYRPLLKSGMCFRAQKWIASLQRQFSTVSNGDHIPGDMFKLSYLFSHHNKIIFYTDSY